MKKKHEKSPCCGEKIYSFGGRRRQCSLCKKTWRLWKRQRGRSAIRISSDLARRFVLHRVLPTRATHAGPSKTRNQRQYRLAQSRKICAAQDPWPEIPAKGSLICIADALIQCIEKKWHTWYFIFVRPIEGHEAIVLPPYHRQGSETIPGWKEAFARVSASILSRIQALVCDGKTGLVYEARGRKWLIQRCHFHLIARLHRRRSKWKTSRHYEEGKRIYSLVTRVLTEPDETKLQPFINDIEEISWTSSSQEARSMLAGFVNRYDDFRTYLHHPELQLPITSNTAESYIRLVTEALSRARGFKHPGTMHEWIICVAKTRKTISCNGKKINRINQS